jgi:hypothetical protein
MHSALSLLKELSISALSYGSPFPLIRMTMP